MLPNINTLCADWARGTPQGDSLTAKVILVVTGSITEVLNEIWKSIAADRNEGKLPKEV